ncbi:hypothetical protein AVEN_195882-1 [Araneus ventricosus]|uniref:Uncharacterized protein n=1 Tax=Araneus ventricosus TaxID=182803 RepID=A0A4Y2DWY5_ARAVE|nr:hypothetical protein AVEN_195882-1 [Araneus ventricosus]
MPTCCAVGCSNSVKSGFKLYRLPVGEESVKLKCFGLDEPRGLTFVTTIRNFYDIGTELTRILDLPLKECPPPSRWV